MSWLRNGLLRLVMSKEALQKMDAYHAGLRSEPQPAGEDVPAPPEPGSGPVSEPELARAVDAAVARIASGEHMDQTDLPSLAGGADPSIGRAALIRRAMAIHKSQQSVLAGLDDATRRKLELLAMQAFFNDKPKT